MQIVRLIFGGLLARKLISIIVGLVIAGLIVMMVTDADFIVQSAAKIGDIISGEETGLVSWITDYITKVINLLKSNMNAS